MRTALVTARSAPAHERAIRTLMDWKIEVDEAMFLGGLPKGEMLREFEPDFFFDDQTGHIENAAIARAGRARGRGRDQRLSRAGTRGAAVHSARYCRSAPRSITRKPPYSMRISPCRCSVCSASLTRCRDNPTR